MRQSMAILIFKKVSSPYDTLLISAEFKQVSQVLTILASRRSVFLLLFLPLPSFVPLNCQEMYLIPDGFVKATQISFLFLWRGLYSLNACQLLLGRVAREAQGH